MDVALKVAECVAKTYREDMKVQRCWEVCGWQCKW